jgi:peptide chain release factor subunit 1
MVEKSKEWYEFKKQLKFLSAQRGSGTELISIYIPPGYNVAEVVNRLRDEYGQAANIKSKSTRKNVQTAIDRIIGMLKGVPKPPEKGVAIFCGSIHDKIELYTVLPPEALQVQLYRCDSEFLLDPLFTMVQPKDVFGLFVMDRREATFAVLKGKVVEIIEHLTSGVPGKHRKGGQSALRFERLHEQAVHDFYKRIGENANQLFTDPKITGIIAGGSGPTKQEFINGEFMHGDVKKKIVGIIDTSYTDEFGIKELTDKAGEVIKELEINKEKDLVNRFLKEATVSGLATYGEQQVRDAIAAGKVSMLLLSESLNWYRVKLRCTACGKEIEKTVKDLAAFEKEPRNCECGGKYEVIHRKEFIEELAEAAELTGAKVEMISTETPEGQQFKSGFGGIGAILRY